ncbi:MAG: hypothetical protein AMXMBFR56_55520 [Polyangiaceae bacterium]
MKNRTEYYLNVDGRQITIKLGEQLYANWQNQFHQKTGPVSSLRKLTLKNMLRAAVRAGLDEARSRKYGS